MDIYSKIHEIYIGMSLMCWHNFENVSQNQHVAACCTYVATYLATYVCSSSAYYAQKLPFIRTFMYVYKMLKLQLYLAIVLYYLTMYICSYTY